MTLRQANILVFKLSAIPGPSSLDSFELSVEDHAGFSWMAGEGMQAEGTAPLKAETDLGEFDFPCVYKCSVG